MRAKLVALISIAALGCGAEEDPLLTTSRPELVPGSQALISGIPVMVPRAGWGVHVEVMFEDGETRALVLETGESGIVDQLEQPAESLALATSPPSACDDTAHSALPHRWNEALRWKLDIGSRPSGMNADALEAAVQRGTSNITSSRNNCRFADLVSARATYEGRTTRGANIGQDGSCRDGDSMSVVDFGVLPSGTLGVACTWYVPSSGAAVESDVRLNRGHRWYSRKPANCSNRFGIEAVMTHERGHTFGLGHVSEARHGRLTMSTRLAPCDDSAVTLGRGDVRGLRAKY